jgi:hypothetical protein
MDSHRSLSQLRQPGTALAAAAAVAAAKQGGATLTAWPVVDPDGATCVAACFPESSVAARVCRALRYISENFILQRWRVLEIHGRHRGS